MIDIFLEKSYRKCDGETIRELFPNQHLWINSLRLSQFVFILCLVEDYRNVLKRNCRSLAFDLQMTADHFI